MKYVILILFPIIGFSQKIFVTGEACKADFDVIYTRKIYQADICVITVSQKHFSGRSRTSRGCDNWFFVDNEWDADYTIRVVNSVHPNRNTLYVYREFDRQFTPPLRDRDDKRNQYFYNDSYNYDNDYYNDRYEARGWRPKVDININLSNRFKLN